MSVKLPGLALLALTLGGCAPYWEKNATDQMLADILADDGDGIDGDADKCPYAREDIDGFEDEDGCPEGASGPRGR